MSDHIEAIRDASDNNSHLLKSIHGRPMEPIETARAYNLLLGQLNYELSPRKVQE